VARRKALLSTGEPHIQSALWKRCGNALPLDFSRIMGIMQLGERMVEEHRKEPYTIAVLVEAADRGGRPVSKSHLSRLCREGRIPAEKVGRAWMIAPRDAELWLIDWLNL